MKKAVTLLVALGLSLSGLAYAKPVKMTDAQMDKVTAGSLVNANGNKVKVKVRL